MSMNTLVKTISLMLFMVLTPLPILPLFYTLTEVKWQILNVKTPSKAYLSVFTLSEYHSYLSLCLKEAQRLPFVIGQTELSCASRKCEMYY